MIQSPMKPSQIEALCLAYRGYPWAIRTQPWLAYGISRQQYMKRIRRFGLGRDVEIEDLLDRAPARYRSEDFFPNLTFV